jgi:hypothetical protein
MPMMSDSRRRRIQAKQRKAKNAVKRAVKVKKRERNGASVASQTLGSGRQVASVWKDATQTKGRLGFRADAEGTKRQSRNTS